MEREQQPLRRRPQQRPHKASQRGGAVFPPVDGQTVWRQPEQEVVMEERGWGGGGGWEWGNQALTPTQISIDPVNLCTIKAERTWL